MNKLKLTLIIVIGVIAFLYILLNIPAPMTKEQLEYDDAVLSAQRYKSARKCDQALKILDTLAEEYPSTAIYLEVEGDGCFEQLKQHDKMYDSCKNSKLTEYMPARAALCSRKLADAGRFDEAVAIWDKNIQDKQEEIFPYCQISKYEQTRVKLNMKLKSLFAAKQNQNAVAELRKNSLDYINNKKNETEKKKTRRK